MTEIANKADVRGSNRFRRKLLIVHHWSGFNALAAAGSGQSSTPARAEL